MKWTQVALGAICDVIAGQSPPSTTYNRAGRGLPFFQGKVDFGEVHPRTRVWCESPERIAEPNDILISVRAPVGPTNMAVERCCIGRGLSAIRCGNRVYPVYLLHYLRFVEPSLSRRGRGSTFSAITGDDLRSFRVPLPPLPEQKRIAAMLDKADAIRRKRRESLRLLDDFLRSVFLDMFGDPVTNPKGWGIVSAGDVFEELKYGTSRKCGPGSGKGTLPVLRIPNIVAGTIDWSDLAYLVPNPREAQTLRLKPGDILFVRTNGNPEYIARCAVYDGGTPALFASYLIRGRLPQGSDFRPRFLKAVLSFPTYRTRLIREAKTTAGNYNIGTQGLRDLRIIAPPVRVQDQFLSIESVARVQSVSFGAEGLDTLFHSLLQRAFRGEL